ncbi:MULTISPECIES: MFS transporter [Brevundimonas]|jgi:MFS family permease|uniref:MFS family permease n=1 Tax=Brevundimonas bullata TaxID=13160 RepID=A0A7W7ISV2_9CAUL|nr:MULTISPECIES: MFS transporter [Brevundimonas]MBB4799587.1 MFS family permease [Brevundimonas bullata]MBB6384342.1 MFS family permease [Brevundimonas bullata]MCW0047330.1 MFS transporter [Brevundimonas sp. BT-123]HBY43573.1 MFS transporter [Brevundimonas sp.]
MTDQSIARRNMAVLTAAQALGGASPPIVMSLGGLVGQHLAADPAWVTFPVSLFGVGLALGAPPAAFIMRRHGRRNGYLLGALFGVASGLVAAFGIFIASFWLFCIGAFTAGLYGSYVQSYRFAAADGAEGDLKAKAISWVMVGGLVAAVVGPQLVIWTRDAVPGTPYVGSFLSQAALALLVIPVLLLLRSPPAVVQSGAGGGRSLGQIMRVPRFILAVATGVVSYGLMAFVMTAAPVAMVNAGHSVDSAALGIQWHLLAMFAPSFFTGRLMGRFGKERVAAVGMVLIAVSAAVALSGMAVANFWLSLMIMGVGWNFSFIGATAMVTDCHTAEERGKAQGANDFFVFGATAIVSFLAGAVLNTSGWQAINWLLFPPVALILAPLLWQAARRSAPPSI